ncbi:MAG: DnaJ domain-containing protein [Chloroflexota bacterium]
MAVSERDYYRILDVEPSATPEQVRSAFRRAAMEHHPDRNPGDPEAAQRFRTVVEAYQVLGDPIRRAAYQRPAPTSTAPTTRPKAPPPGWAHAYAQGRATATANASAQPSLGQELGALFGEIAASTGLDRRMKQLLRYLEGL